jgi:hypothetical protein
MHEEAQQNVATFEAAKREFLLNQKLALPSASETANQTEPELQIQLDKLKDELGMLKTYNDALLAIADAHKTEIDQVSLQNRKLSHQLDEERNNLARQQAAKSRIQEQLGAMQSTSSLNQKGPSRDEEIKAPEEEIQEQEVILARLEEDILAPF